MDGRERRDLLLKSVANTLPNVALPVDTRLLVPGIGLGNLVSSAQRRKIIKPKGQMADKKLIPYRKPALIFEHSIKFDLLDGPPLPILANHELGHAKYWAKYVVPDAERVVFVHIFPSPQQHVIELQAGMTVGDLLVRISECCATEGGDDGAHMLRLVVTDRASESSSEHHQVLNPVEPFSCKLSAAGVHEGAHLQATAMSVAQAREHSGWRARSIDGLQAVTSTACSEQGCSILVAVANEHMDLPWVQVAACRKFAEYASTSTERRRHVATSGAVSTVVAAMTSGIGKFNVGLQEAGCCMLGVLGEEDEFRRKVQEAHGGAAVATALKNHCCLESRTAGNSSAATPCQLETERQQTRTQTCAEQACQALETLRVGAAVEVVVNVLLFHGTHSKMVAKYGCANLSRSIFDHDMAIGHRERIGAAGGAVAAVSMLNAHGRNDADVAKQACGLIRLLIHDCRPNTTRVVEADGITQVFAVGAEHPTLRQQCESVLKLLAAVPSKPKKTLISDILGA
eukprot:SAG31_NODE_5739_length_2350_cov_4.439360_1_plen_514_part_00